LPAAAQGTPFGKRIHALALYLKSNQLFSYQRLQGVFSDLFGLKLSQGALMNMFHRAAPIFAAGRDNALGILRRAEVVACDETGVRIEGINAYQWVFCSAEAIVHTADFTRAAQVVLDTMDGHQPEVWISDRYTAQQRHGQRHQTCLAHLDRKALRSRERQRPHRHAIPALVRPRLQARPHYRQPCRHDGETTKALVDA
jgi:transposase